MLAMSNGCVRSVFHPTTHGFSCPHQHAVRLRRYSVRNVTPANKTRDMLSEGQTFIGGIFQCARRHCFE